MFLQTLVMHSRSGANQGGHNNLNLLTYSLQNGFTENFQLGFRTIKLVFIVRITRWHCGRTIDQNNRCYCKKILYSLHADYRIRSSRTYDRAIDRADWPTLKSSDRLSERLTVDDSNVIKPTLYWHDRIWSKHSQSSYRLRLSCSNIIRQPFKKQAY